MASLCIVTASHLCRNPRVVKEATALAAHGHDVTVLRPLLNDDLAMLDEEISRSQNWKVKVSVDLRQTKVEKFRRILLRAGRRFGAESIRLLGWETVWALGYGPRQTLKAANQENADLYIGHQEVGAWVVCQLMKEGKKVGADFEDWYSKDLLPEARTTRPLKLLMKCENLLLKHGSHVTTTSKSMAIELAETYKTKEPTTIYNVFPWGDRLKMDAVIKDRSGCALPSLHWASQTIGSGRGLDLLCEALRLVEHPVAIHLRGSYTPAVEEWLRASIPVARGHKLHLHDMVPPDELLSRIAEHDIGLALEPKEPENKNHTISNKMFHYLLGGVAVVATDTAGQSEISRLIPMAVRLCQNNDPADLASQLNYLLGDPQRLKEAKAASLVAARARFCWELQSEILIGSVERALHSN